MFSDKYFRRDSMIRYILIFIFSLFTALSAKSQVSDGGQPYSVSMQKLKGTAPLPEYKLKSFDRSALVQEDRLHPSPFRYAIFEDALIDIKSTGKRDTVTGQAGSIWRLKLHCDSAYSLQVIFSTFIIPPGAKLFVYSKGYENILGAFIYLNMNPDSTLAVEDLRGSTAVIEYFEPDGAIFKGRIVIGSVSKSYKDIFHLKSGSDYININCTEGKNLQLPKHAVCRISFRSGTSSYLCSGALINNARQDGKPYFLTANHCIKDSAEAATLIAYFNYENNGCDGSVMTARTLSGATIISTSPASDYSLLLLNNTPPPSYQPFYAGWDANDNPASRVAGIHHPEGLTKKLSIDRDSILSNSIKIQWEGNSTSPVASHWQVDFEEGLTAGGSSGSPLFNSKDQIIGQLHGGDDTNDLYGKLSYSWNHTSGKYLMLNQFLDPDNTGVLALQGYSPPGNPPDAFIDIPVSKVCLEAPVQLTDYSVFEPYLRTWIITPSTFVFTDGTTESSANPAIKFLQPGFYSVALKISKPFGVDSMKIDNAFQAGDSIELAINSAPEGEACLCDLGHFHAWASGATDYEWKVLPGSLDKVHLDKDVSDTVEIRPIPGFAADSSVIVNIIVTGSHGTCKDTAYLDYVLIKQPNDYIQDAVLLSYGKSETYSNKCATIEAGEPIPQHYSCTTQYSWCDEYGTGENIVEKSIWFKFKAGPSGYINIESEGFDNEIALYEADSYLDIVNQNFTIVAANDDRSTTDFNPFIRSQKITPTKTYWIQVDGSGGGLEGTFNLNLMSVVVTDLENERSDLLQVYPQPAEGFVNIKGRGLNSGPVLLTVFSSSGDLVLKDRIYPDGDIITLNINSWEKGIYIIKIETDKDMFVRQLVKY